MSELALGLDVGAVRTKAAGTTLWHGPSAFADAPGGRRYGAEALAGGVLRHGFLAARAWRSLGEFLGGVVAPGGPVDVEPRSASVVMAVPDDWTRGVGPTWTSVVDSTPAGVEVRRALADAPGFGSVRLVPGTQCAASDYLDRHPGVRGCLLVCDVGAGTVDAAVFACGEGTTRLLDAEHGSVADTGLPDRLLRAAGPGDDPAWRLMALEHARCRDARRARVVLDRAVTHERYLETPAYLPGAHGGALTARVVLDALRPLAELVGRVVATVTARVAEPLLPEVVATGGNVLGPVVGALGDRVHLLDPGAAARGARSIAAGRTTALDGYPHELGVAVRRVERG
ncbi:MAG: hypothetical protein HOV94_43175, partial [Saccharothrix sp.]|nr:hypothetical protein [Saccharothrix sp.]